jgi:hypothetical protein
MNHFNEIIYECINLELEFLADQMNRNWEIEGVHPKRNAQEKKDRLWYIEKSKEQIKFYQSMLKNEQKSA